MKIVTLAVVVLSLFAQGVPAQTNRTDRASSPPPAPPAAPAGGESIGMPRIEITTPPAKQGVEVGGALVRLGKRSRLGQPVVPPGGVPTRQDTDRLAADPLTREYTGYNLLVIKF